MPELGEIRQIKKTVSMKYIWLACNRCKEERWVRYAPSRNTAMCRNCYNQNREELAHRGADSHAWKGGRVSKKGGYVAVHIEKDNRFFDMADSNHYIPEHRLIVAQSLGRCLEKDEHIHHKNGVRKDNRLENLELQTPSEHTPQAHYKARIRKLEKEIAELKRI